MSASFFGSIPTFTNFNGVIDEYNFIPAPTDWLIVIADIRNSTGAVSAGKYKDVNFIGGSVICAVQNATGTRDWPFVFGGDGATVLISPAVRTAVESMLVQTRQLAKDEFDLDLRIGFVPVSDVRDRGAEVLVARYEASPGNHLAQFGGGGVELADELIKADSAAEKYAVPAYTAQGLPDLSGMSCRWEPLPAQHGKIVCLLIKPQTDNFGIAQSVLSEFLSQLSQALGSELNQASPVTEKSLRFSWPPKGLASEAKATRKGRSYVRHLIGLYINSFIQWFLERFDLKAGAYNAPVYRDEMKANSDFCRFDDVLRMVLDCSTEQVKKVRELLEQMHAAGAIDYGIFETDQALMTCLLFDLESSQHLHFIDGDNGGFYSASVGLKEQLAAR